MDIASRVTAYLLETEDKYFPGQDEYYARLALAQAVKAYEEGNYGIGAVAVVVRNDRVREFRARNAMVTGLGVVDHAETRALLRMKGGKRPDVSYPRRVSELTAKLPEGVSMYGTLEPCPMCAVTLTNVGASRSISTVLDGHLAETDDGFRVSDGAAASIGEKAKLQPRVWQEIQRKQGLEFALLDTFDKDLRELSSLIFLETREEIDQRLADEGLTIYSAARVAGL
jgi:tRNA(Arg) A34 adenosine deaminase TadA